MRVLHIEDDLFVAELFRKGLKAQHIVVDSVPDVEEAEAAIAAVGYDAVILDLNLGKASGFDFLKSLRYHARKMPVIVISARNSLEDKIAALNAGADDYVVKPIQLAELGARLHALLRRPQQLRSPERKVGNLTFIPHAKAASVDDVQLQLSYREVLLLRLLIDHQGRPLTRQAIGDHLYGFGEEVTSNAVEVLMFRLRAKLQAASADVEIVTSRGLGYTLQKKSA